VAKRNQNFSVYQGDDERQTIPIVGTDGVTPFTMTGYTTTQVKWQAWDPLVPATIILDYAIGSGLTIVSVDGTDDGVQIDITDTESALLAVGVLRHECWITDATPRTKTAFAGELRVLDSIKA